MGGWDDGRLEHFLTGFESQGRPAWQWPCLQYTYYIAQPQPFLPTTNWVNWKNCNNRTTSFFYAFPSVVKRTNMLWQESQNLENKKKILKFNIVIKQGTVQISSSLYCAHFTLSEASGRSFWSRTTGCKRHKCDAAWVRLGGWGGQLCHIFCSAKLHTHIDRLQYSCRLLQQCSHTRKGKEAK